MTVQFGFSLQGRGALADREAIGGPFERGFPIGSRVQRILPP